MATSLTDLLDCIDETAAQAIPGSAASDDARFALGRLGAALTRLVVDGIDANGTGTNGVDKADGERARWVRELARACAQSGQPPVLHASAVPGRLAELAYAADLTATLHRDELGSGQRWATTVALADTVLGLTQLAEGPDPSDAAVRTLSVVTATATVVSRFAALDPPNAKQSAVLDRPVPDPFPRVDTADARVDEAFAGLVHSTRPGAGPHSLATILAVSLAAESLCRAAAGVQGGTERTRRDALAASDAWAGIRVAMTPINDGSRLPRGVMPAPVSYALAAHRTLLAASDPSHADHSRWAAAAMTNTLRRLPDLAQHVSAAILDATNGGRLLAHARDLPFRESRVEQFLAGRRPGGLVTADIDDVRAVLAASGRAENLSTALGEGMAGTVPFQSAREGARPAAERPFRPGREPVAGLRDRSGQERSAAAAHEAAATLLERRVSGPRR